MILNIRIFSTGKHNIFEDCHELVFNFKKDDKGHNYE